MQRREFISLNWPGGNVTGVNTMNAELGAKRLGLLNELVPAVARIAVLVNPSPAIVGFVTDVRAAAGRLGRHVEVFIAWTPEAKQIIAELARTERGVALSALHQVIDLEWMQEAHRP